MAFAYLIADYIQGAELFNVIQALTDEQKYNIGKEIARFIIELRSITDGFYDIGHYIPSIPRYAGSWKDGHLEYAALLRSRLSEMSAEIKNSDIIAAAFDYIYANINALEYQAGAKLLHNDLHPKNIIIHNGGLAGIIDWECSQFGEEDFELTHLFHWRVYSMPGDSLGLLLESVVENLGIASIVPHLEKRLTIYQLEHELNQLIWNGKKQEEERTRRI